MIKSMVEDWFFLALLGTIMAILSLLMDLVIESLHEWHLLLYQYSRAIDLISVFNVMPVCAFAIWCLFSVGLVLASATFVHYLAPQAIGSGIPEMKTILRGVLLKEYLTFRTLMAKMVGLTLSLGSGMPIGKEGPFVHVASVVANLLSSLTSSYHNAHANESRHWEMLVAACAVGVSSTFSAPIGGVLFSIEVTSVHFAVKDYWRGFFSATCCAFLLNLLRFITETEVTMVAFYQTNFRRDAFFPREMPIFACIGWMVYPVTVSLIITAASYPNGIGGFLNGKKTYSQITKDFFVSCTYSAPVNASNRCPDSLLENFLEAGEDNILFALSTFCVASFVFSVLASTLPVPSGIFGPSYVLGAALGRLIGEMVAIYFPEGIHGPLQSNIFPGVYSVVGAAAFVAGVTHTISVAVIVFELTGQVFFLLPVMLAVLIANTISSHLQLSIYDSMIKIKRLPYLPAIPHAFVDIFHGLKVEQFMTGKLHFISRQSSYAQVKQLLAQQQQINTFPIVENPESRILIGTCSRRKLLKHIAVEADTRSSLLFSTKRDADRSKTLSSSFLQKRSFSSDNLRDSVAQLMKSESLCDAETLPTKKKKGMLKRSITTFSFARVKDAARSQTKNFKQDCPTTRIGWQKAVNFDELEIDSAPLQVMPSCSLFKLHSLFSLMKLSRAYVTKCGKLIGLITLEDLRMAVDNVKNGKLLGTEQEFSRAKTSLSHKEAEENLNNDVLTPKLEVVQGDAKKLSKDYSKMNKNRIDNLL